MAGENRLWGIRAALVALALSCLPVSPATAHPHVWIDMQTELQFDAEGRLASIGILWIFDEFYSAFALEGAEKTAEGYDEEWLAGLAEINLQNLAEWDYFTEVTTSGQPVALGAARDGKSTWDEAAGRLSLSFTVPLATPLQLASAPAELRIFDPTYYISIDYLKDDPVRQTGAVPTGCSFESRTPDIENVWLGLPETAFTDPSSRLGAHFATIVTATCPPAP